MQEISNLCALGKWEFNKSIIYFIFSDYYLLVCCSSGGRLLIAVAHGFLEAHGWALGSMSDRYQKWRKSMQNLLCLCHVYFPIEGVCSFYQVIKVAHDPKVYTTLFKTSVFIRKMKLKVV